MNQRKNRKKQNEGLFKSTSFQRSAFLVTSISVEVSVYVLNTKHKRKYINEDKMLKCKR